MTHEDLSDEELMQVWKNETSRMNIAYMRIRIIDTQDARNAFQKHSDTCQELREEALKRGLVSDFDWRNAKKPWEH